MKFSDYWSGLAPQEKQNLAERLSTSKDYLYQLAAGHRNAGAKFLLAIESATNGKVKPDELRNNSSLT